MRPVVISARAGVPPTRLRDLGPGLDEPLLVAAGQALTWGSPFSRDGVTAIPLDRASAVVVDNAAGAEQWYARFARGLAHSMAGEFTVAAVAAGTVTGASEKAELDWAIGGLGRLLKHLEDPRDMGRIVGDTARTHVALLGRVDDQRVEAEKKGEFTVHTVRSKAALPSDELERARTRIGQPWPTRVESTVGRELGLARWRRTVQDGGHQMWCRVEDDDTLVTELWLRHPRAAAG